MGCCRFTYNSCLAFKIKTYNEEKKSVSFGEIWKYLVELKNQDDTSFLKDVHSKVLQQTLINLEAAYKSFFKNGQGFPKFKSKKYSRESCRFPVDAIGKVFGNRINIIKPLKDIHFKCSKRDEKYLNQFQDQIKSATLSKSKQGYHYFSLLVDIPVQKELQQSNNSIGIDLGIKTFIVDSNGHEYENIKVTRNNQKRLSKLQRRVSKKIKGSKNKEKSRIKLAKYHEKLSNIKNNYLHQVSNKLLEENQLIVIEDLNVSGMMKNHKLAKSIQVLSMFKFKEILAYKCNWYGRDLIQIDRFFPSSKLCGECGHKNNDLTLKDREWKCPSCNTTHLRDLNAAKNILKEGLRILKIGLSSPELTLQEIGQ